MSGSVKRQVLDHLAWRCSLDVFVWSPGDGMTRYKFCKLGDQAGYSAGDGLAVLCGRREAWLWLRGYYGALCVEGFEV